MEVLILPFGWCFFSVLSPFCAALLSGGAAVPSSVWWLVVGGAVFLSSELQIKEKSATRQNKTKKST